MKWLIEFITDPCKVFHHGACRGGFCSCFCHGGRK